MKLHEQLIPNEKKLESLSNYLTKIYSTNCINQQEIDLRFDLFLNIKMKFLLQYPGKLFFLMLKN
jgi:hypothetical protein